MTLTDGLWVAMIRWIPAARASWARRQIASSTSPGATIIRSASSSTMITICGIFSGAFSPSGPAYWQLFCYILQDYVPHIPQRHCNAGHFRNSPVQRTGRFLRICDYRNEQVRDPVIYTELHHLRIDHDQTHLIRCRLIKDADDQRIDADGFPEPVAPAIRR